jgi:hypothetical protein
MVRTTGESREQILADLGRATEALELASASLTGAYELLDEATADRLEADLYRPVQRALGRAKRTYSGFASRFGLAARVFEQAPTGAPSQGVKRFVERAVEATAGADRVVAELQDSMLPIEAGDAELRTGLAEVRELVAGVPARSREFLSTLGR